MIDFRILALIIIIAALLLILKFLSNILKAWGYHPDYLRKDYDLKGKKALIISTSRDKMGKNDTKTGVFASELTTPYYEFLDAKMAVDLASIQGGKIPFEPFSLRYPLATAADYRFLADAKAQAQADNSLKIDDIDFGQYDIIFLAGGWGAAFDLGQSDILGAKITEAHANGILLGSVCHGALGFIKALDTDGRPLVEGKQITAVSDRQIRQLGIVKTPLHPERELRALGANYQKNSAWTDILATKVVVDNNIISGQNQNSAGASAQKLLELLAAKG